MRVHFFAGTRGIVALLTVGMGFKVVVAEGVLDTGLAVTVQPAR